MDKREEIAEVDGMLQKNEEDTEVLQRRLSNIQGEEALFRYESRSQIRNMDRLSEDVKGAVFEKIQSDAVSSFDKLQHDVDLAFQEEHEQIKKRLNTLYDEKDDLLNRKKQLQEEVE